MATKLKNLKVTSVDLVPAGANPDAHVCLFKTKNVKTEGGVEYPADAYAYVPDPDKPSTWKLRLWESPDKKVTAKQVGMAVAALGTGFRGNKVDIPDDDLAAVKAKVLAAWKQANPDATDDDIPDVLKTDAKKSLAKRLFSAIAKALGIEDEGAAGAVQKGGSAETFADALKDRQMQQVTNQIWDTTYAFNESFASILMDDTVDPDQKSDMMTQSLGEFDDALKGLIDAWSSGQPAAAVAKADDTITPQRLEFAKAAKERIEAFLTKAESGQGAQPPKVTKGVTDTMKIDKSKMSPEEAAQLDAFEKKYGVSEGGEGGEGGNGGEPTPGIAKAGSTWTCPECGTSCTGKFCPDDGTAKPAVKKSGAEGAPAGGEGAPNVTKGAPEMNPEVKKALEEVEKMRGQLELRDQIDVAKKYEVLGKKPDDVAKKLVELKKCGGTAYTDYVALLDEQVNLVEKSGLFGEIGSNAADGGGSAWDKVNKAADEVLKSDSTLSRPAAIAKACSLHPELRVEYERDYTGR